jgi:hypothetical protein
MRLNRLDWNEPHDIYQSLTAQVQDGRGGDTTNVQRIETLRRATEWADKEVLRASPEEKEPQTLWVSPYSYLLEFPWSFCGIARAWIHERNECANSEINVLVAFSSGTMGIALRSVALGPVAKQVTVLSDPRGDIPALKDGLAKLQELADQNVIQLRPWLGLEASKVRFLSELQQSDIFAFVGHGRSNKFLQSASLLCSLGKEVSGADLAGLACRYRRGPRVAIILSCWGGQLSFLQSLNSWEPEGVVYGLRACGYDYVISVLWPISVRMANAFLPEFLLRLQELQDVPAAFGGAYSSLFRTFGFKLVAVEAASLQLTV